MNQNKKPEISYSALVVLFGVALLMWFAWAFSQYPTTNTVTATQSQSVTINTDQSQPKININTATVMELQNLPGIGDALAERIILHRPYGNVWEIANVPGIGGETLKNIIERIEV